MATKIKIGHASISEKGSVTGTAGDSTGNEVCIRENYDVIANLNPNVVLRPKSKALAEASAIKCAAGCNNDNIGYSQGTRNTLYNLAKDNEYDLANVGPCNTDCSAFMTVCAIAGGSKIAYGSNAPTTSNMRTRFKQSGDYSVLTDSKHLTMTDYLKRGDILVREGSHTLMVLENGIKMAEDEAEVTTVTILNTHNITLKFDKISADSVEITINITEQKTGAAAKLLTANKVKKYNWTYTLEPVGRKASAKSLSVTSGQLKLPITGLKAGSSYMLRVIAKKDDVIAFCSPKVLFTTLTADKQTENKKQIFTNDSLNTIDKVYIRINDEYKPTIVYTTVKEVD